ncbi:MAG: serine hydrolase [Desulfurococcaceae archaeon]
MTDNLEKIIQETSLKFIERYKARVGIGVKDLKSGKEYYINGDIRFQPASVFKIFILSTLYDQAVKGNVDLDKMISIDDQEISPGSGILRHFTGKYSFKIRDLAGLMMILSDNTATDLILNLVGKDNVNETIKRYGLHDSKVVYSCKELIFKALGTSDPRLLARRLKSRRPKIDLDFLRNYETNNVTTPRDIVKILELLYYRKILTPVACNEIIDIMKRCQTGEARMKRYLPPSVEVAHKTGTIAGIVNDAGIVFCGKRDFILAIFLNEIPLRNGRYVAIGEDFIAKLSYKVYRAIISS